MDSSKKKKKLYGGVLCAYSLFLQSLSIAPFVLTLDEDADPEKFLKDESVKRFPGDIYSGHFWRYTEATSKQIDEIQHTHRLPTMEEIDLRIITGEL